MKAYVRCVGLVVAFALSMQTGTVFARESPSDAPSSSDGSEPSTSEPPRKQAELQRRAVEQMEKGDYDRATKLLQRALELGGYNILYLTLGRAHQKADACEPAEHAYERALDAPAVPKPPP